MGRTFTFALAFLALAAATALAAPATQPDDDAPRFNRGPYLLWPAQTSMMIVFELNVPLQNVVLRYGEGERTDRAVNLKGQPFDYQQLKGGLTKGRTAGWLKADMLEDVHGFEYRAELKDLKPGTAYSYAIEGPGLRAEPIPFHTVPAKADKFSFIAYGDSRSVPENHRKLAAQFLRYKPAFILHVGDYSDSGGYVFWNAEFFAPLRDVIDRVPLLPALGDHEGRGAYRRAFCLAPDASTQYVFNYGIVRVAAIDNAYGNVTPKRFEWLDKDFAGDGPVWKVVFYHKPMLDEPVLHRLGADLAFAGHDHSYQRYAPQTMADFPGQAVTHVITGGGGAPLKNPWRQLPNRPVAKSCYEFVVVDVDGPRITLRAIDDAGKEFDRVSWSKADGRADAEYLKLAWPLEPAPGE